MNENKTVYSAFVLLLSSNERETGLWSVIVFAGAEQTPAYSLHAGADTLLLVPHICHSAEQFQIQVG